jgi:hypothetical protein
MLRSDGSRTCRIGPGPTLAEGQCDQILQTPALGSKISRGGYQSLVLGGVCSFEHRVSTGEISAHFGNSNLRRAFEEQRIHAVSDKDSVGQSEERQPSERYRGRLSYLILTSSKMNCSQVGASELFIRTALNKSTRLIAATISGNRFTRARNRTPP